MIFIIKYIIVNVRFENKLQFNFYRIETPLLEELWVFFGTKRLIYTYFPEKLTTSENWLYMNLFDFEIDYAAKIEEDEDLIEEFRVKFKETTNEENE